MTHLLMLINSVVSVTPDRLTLVTVVSQMPRGLLQTGATHAQLFVDTCFVMSGLLVSLLELAKNHAQVTSVVGKQHDDRPNLMAAMVHRYVRSV